MFPLLLLGVFWVPINFDSFSPYKIIGYISTANLLYKYKSIF